MLDNQQSIWSIYLIRTVNSSLYTGITTNVTRRFQEHQSNKGAKNLKGKGPLSLVYYAEIGDRSLASKIEYKVKQLAKNKKEQLVKDQPSSDVLISLFSVNFV